MNSIGTSISCFLFLIWGCYVHAQTVSFQDWQSGISTFYDGIDGGHCSYGSVPTSSFPYGYIVAPNTLTYADSDACGRCYEVQCLSPTTAGCNGCYVDSNTGENKIITVLVTDECPSCEDSENQFDLSQPAFNLIADTTCGVINMQYRHVSCDVSGNIIVRNKDGVNAWWYALFLDNVANYGEISKVEIRDSSSGASWVEGTSTVYNGFIFTSSSGFQAPLDVRLTDGAGTVITGTDVVTDFIGTNEFNFGSNFPIAGGTSTSGDDDDDDDDDTTDTTITDTTTDTDAGDDDDDDDDNNGDDDDDDDNIIIQNKDGINQWWYALYIQNLADGNDIKSVELKDSKLGYYVTGASTTYGAYVFQSNNGGWVTPFSIRITNTQGNSIESVNLVTDINEYSEFNFGNNFDANGRVINGDTTDTEGDNTNEDDESSTSGDTKKLKDEVSALEWGLGIAIGAIVVAIIVGAVCWFQKRKQKQGKVGYYVSME